MLKRLKIVAFSLLFLSASHSFAALNSSEKEISSFIRDNQKAQTALLAKLVNINSGTANIKGIHQVGEIVSAEFKQLGFKTRWEALPASMHKAGTFIAERKGDKGKKILLIGHLDTVFSQDSSFKKFIVENNIAKGPGVIDDKGGVVVILYALKALQTVHALDHTTIKVVLTGDEEDSGKPTSISRKPLIAAAKGMDVALDFEPAMTLDTATIARRGISNWSIEARGIESHSASIFHKEVGDGAIFEMARILNAFREQLGDKAHMTFNPGLLLAGTRTTYDKPNAQGSAFGKQNVVAKVAIAKGDMRFLSQKQKEWIEDKMTAIVKHHLPGTNAAITFEAAIPAMSPTELNLDLLRQYSKASTDLGRKPIGALPAESRGAGDISHVAAIVPANLAGLGAAGSGAHSTAEEIELNSLPVQTERAAVLIYRLIK